MKLGDLLNEMKPGDLAERTEGEFPARTIKMTRLHNIYFDDANGERVSLSSWNVQGDWRVITAPEKEET